MKKNSYNDLLYLGIFILFVGISLLCYSIVSYKEVKKLESQIDFEELEDPKLPSSKKYDKYIIISDFLNNNLEKYKNLPVKSTVCIYLDYSQHNAISLYNLVYNSNTGDQVQKDSTLKYLKYLYSQYGNYKTCKSYESYHKEIANLVDKAEKDKEMDLLKESNMEKFLYGNNQNIERYIEDKSNSQSLNDNSDSIKQAEQIQQETIRYENPVKNNPNETY